MTTTTVFGDAADGIVSSSDAVYATAAAGSGFFVDTTSGDLQIGQLLGYECVEGFIGFNTSPIPDADVVSAGVLSLVGFSDNSDTDFTVEARLFDWSTTVTSADFRTPAQLGSATLLASISTTAYVAAYMAFTDVAMVANINQTGFTRMVINSSRHRSSTTPSGNEFMNFESGDAAGTTTDPKLVVTHAAAAVGQPSQKRMGGVVFAGAGPDSPIRRW